MKKIEHRVVIVTRETRLEKVLVSQNTVAQARFYITRLGGDFDDYQEEHTRYGASVQRVRRDIEALGNLQVIDRKFLPNFIFAADDIVVVIGQDGLVANTLKYLDGQPVIGVNPDAARWDGVLLPFTPEEAARIVMETAAGRRKREEVCMAQARIQNGQELFAVNDFFIGQKTHTSARYVLKHDGLKEPQSSSGIIVSTGLGSTGWMKSVIAGATRINESVIGRPYGGRQESASLIEENAEIMAESAFLEMAASVEEEKPYEPKLYEPPAFLRKSEPDDLSEPKDFREVDSDSVPTPAAARKRFLSKEKRSYGPSELSSVVGKWSSRELIFAVREPFPSKTTGTQLIFGKIAPNEVLRIESLMGENGVIFSDGIENDFIAFNSGAEVTIGLADKRGRIVV